MGQSLNFGKKEKKKKKKKRGMYFDFNFPDSQCAPSSQIVCMYVVQLLNFFTSVIFLSIGVCNENQWEYVVKTTIFHGSVNFFCRLHSRH